VADRVAAVVVTAPTTGIVGGCRLELANDQPMSDDATLGLPLLVPQLSGAHSTFESSLPSHSSAPPRCRSSFAEEWLGDPFLITEGRCAPLAASAEPPQLTPHSAR